MAGTDEKYKDSIQEDAKSEKSTKKEESKLNGQSKVSPEEEAPKVVNPTKKLMKYMRKELALFVIGTIALLGGSLGELANPYYIGMFVDNLNDK